MTEYKLVIDCSTGKQEYLELTPAEMAQRDQEIAKAKEAEAKRETEMKKLSDLKASAKAKLIAGEPLTEEEAAAIVI
jgi:hypothetical protein